MKKLESIILNEQDMNIKKDHSEEWEVATTIKTSGCSEQEFIAVMKDALPRLDISSEPVFLQVYYYREPFWTRGVKE